MPPLAFMATSSWIIRYSSELIMVPISGSKELLRVIRPQVQSLLLRIT